LSTYLVTITPLEVLGADVLVGILGALRQRRKVVPVLPVLRPQPVSVGSRDSKGRDNGTFDFVSLLQPYPTDPMPSVEFSLIRRLKRYEKSRYRKLGGGHTREKSSSRALNIRLEAISRRNGRS
jgi:hypothetical protein